VKVQVFPRPNPLNKYVRIFDVFACFGQIDRSKQGDVGNLLRSDTPKAIRLLALLSQV
jgi:hypothetical protein